MRAIVVFVAITYGLAAALGLVVGLSGGYQSPLVGPGRVWIALGAVLA